MYINKSESCSMEICLRGNSDLNCQKTVRIMGKMNDPLYTVEEIKVLWP